MIKIIIVALISALTFANSKEQYDKFMSTGMYFSAYTSIFELDISKFKKEEIERTLVFIDPSIIKADSRIERFRGVPGFEYAIGIKEFDLKRYSSVIKLMEKVSDVGLRPFAQFLSAQSYYNTNDFKNANLKYVACTKDAQTALKSFKKQGFLYKNLYGNCMQSIARIFFHNKDYIKAVKYFKKIPQENYMWPLSLIEVAWAYYWSGDLSRSLGTMIAFKVEGLRKFYSPEVHYLRALIYYELCYYGRSEDIIKNFEANIWDSYSDLIKLFKSSANVSFDNLIRSLNQEKYMYINLYIQQLKKSPKYKKYNFYASMIDKEMKKLEPHRKNELFNYIYNNLKDYKTVMKITRDNVVREKIYEYAIEIKQVQKRIVKLKLNINLKKRQLVRAKNELEFDKTMLAKSISSIKNSKEKYIWEFKGGYWVDEMGDYAVAVENKCN